MTSSLGEAHFFEESMNATKVRSYLASNKEAEKSRGMKFLLANMSKGRDMSEFFPDVVKNVVVRAVEVKKMVYMYLVHYADATMTCRELALLSINSFQKDLAAANQLIRALALRVMTSIRVPDIIQIQLLAIFKCASDSSPYVRRCAATAVPKVYAVDASQLPSLIQVLEKLLKDSSTMVLGSAVAAFNEVCPTQYELLHRCYRKLCHLLADMDEWTQISVLNVLTRYVRTQFTDPAPGTREAIRAQRAAAMMGEGGGGGAGGTVKVKRRVVKKAFYSDEEDMSEEEEVHIQQAHHPAIGLPPLRNNNTTYTHNQIHAATHSNPTTSYRSADAELEAADLDPDHKLLLRSSLPLLKSRNCGVVLAVCSLHYYDGTQTEGTAAQLGKSLVRISRNRREIAFVVLKAIASMAAERPSMFRPFLQDFFVKPATDPSFCRTLKLDILTALIQAENVTLVLKELQSYVKHSDKDFVCAAVRAVGRVADAHPEVAAKCLNGLMSLLACIRSEKVAGQAVVVIRQLLQQNKQDTTTTNNGNTHTHTSTTSTIDTDETARVVKQLAHVLLKEKGKQVPPTARASLIWIVGEFLRFVGPAGADILRLLAQSFPEEEAEVKIQIVNLAMKLHLYHQAQKRLNRVGLQSQTLTQEGEEEEEEEDDDDAVAKLVRYVLEVARFDTNYDIRDRTRLITASLGLAAAGGGGGEGGEGGGGADAAALVSLRGKAEEVFVQPKLPPLTLLGPVAMEGWANLTISSLSWMLNHKVAGYEELPEWVSLPPDPSVRDAPKQTHTQEEGERGVIHGGGGAFVHTHGHAHTHTQGGGEEGSVSSGFYSDESGSGSEGEDEVSSSSEGGGDEGSSSSSSSGSDSDASSSSYDSSSSSSGYSSEGSASEKDERRRPPVVVPPPVPPPAPTHTHTHKQKSAAAKASTSSSSSSYSSSGEESSSTYSSGSDSDDEGGGSSSTGLDDSQTPAQTHTHTHRQAAAVGGGGYDHLGMDLLAGAGGGGGGGNGSGLTPPTSSRRNGGKKEKKKEKGAGGDTSLLDLEAYASSKTPTHTHTHTKKEGQNGDHLTSLIQGLGATSISGGGGGEGGLLSLSTSTGTTHTHTHTPRVLSAPRELLRHEMGGGLAVEYCFARDDISPSAATTTTTTTTTTTNQNTCTLLLKLTNMRDSPLRRIKIMTTSTSDFSRLLPFPEIPLLEGGATIEVKLGIDVGKIDGGNLCVNEQSLRLQFVTDRGGPFPVNVVLPPEELLRVCVYGEGEVVEIQRALTGGFHEGKAAFVLPSAVGVEEVPEKVLQVANVGMVSSLSRWKEERVALFAALLRKKRTGGAGGSERVVLQVSMDEKEEVVKIQVNCDDAMMSATLVDVLKRGLANPHPPRRL